MHGSDLLIIGDKCRFPLLGPEGGTLATQGNGSKMFSLVPSRLRGGRGQPWITGGQGAPKAPAKGPSKGEGEDTKTEGSH